VAPCYNYITLLERETGTKTTQKQKNFLYCPVFRPAKSGIEVVADWLRVLGMTSSKEIEDDCGKLPFP